MMPPRAIVSDIHAHAWSTFAKTDANGVNSRLNIICNELLRAGKELITAGGYEMIIAGDLFHVRGAIDPEVFNPIHDTIVQIIAMGITIYAIPGNHDLKGKETSEIGNAMQTLGALRGFKMVTSPTVIDDMAFIPWCSSPQLLRDQVAELKRTYVDPSEIDLFIHAPINGVLKGIPDHGLEASEVAAWGFRRVYSGHYHNFKVMEGGRVVSIGAISHQTWSDVGSKAGFLIFDEMKTDWHASHAPSFVDIDETTDEDEIPMLVDQNYVRVRGLKLDDAEIKIFRQGLIDMGAVGTSFQIARQVVSARSSGPVVALSLEQSLAKYITDQIDPAFQALVQAQCNDILSVASNATV